MNQSFPLAMISKFKVCLFWGEGDTHKQKGKIQLPNHLQLQKLGFAFLVYILDSVQVISEEKRKDSVAKKKCLEARVWPSFVRKAGLQGVQ